MKKLTKAVLSLKIWKDSADGWFYRRCVRGRDAPDCEQHQHGLLENQFGHGFHRGQLKRYGGLAESVAWAPLARDFSRAEMMRLRATTSIKTGGSNMTFVLSAGS
jgi:hypothetical protein